MSGSVWESLKRKEEPPAKGNDTVSLIVSKVILLVTE